MKKRKLFSLLAVLLANVICTVLVLTVPIETTNLKIYGSFAAIILVAAVTWRFPMRFYLLSMGFVFLASTLGSCLNLYRHLGFYDLFVHYLSGIVLAEGGMIIAQALSKKYPTHQQMQVILATLFSCTGAAAWEIYEFCADLLANAQMQASKENTMGDIICGVLGALTYLLISFIRQHCSNQHRSTPT